MVGERAISVGDSTATLRWVGVPTIGGGNTAAIGSIASADRLSLCNLLDDAVRQATHLELDYLIGPMERTTWQTYRCVTSTDGSAPFPMEPSNPPWYGAAFEDAGFRAVGRYVSSIDDAMTTKPSPGIERRLDFGDFTARSFDSGHAQDDLESIYKVSRVAFRRNLLYTEIALAEFLTIYRSMLTQIDPRYVRLAFDRKGQPVAFVFGFVYRAAPDGAPRLVIKSYASIVPGLGRFLAQRAIHQAEADGCTAVVHALMSENNVSAIASRRLNGRVFRRYALFGRALRGRP